MNFKRVLVNMAASPFRSRLIVQLSKSGNNIIVVTDGQSAIDMIRKKEIDLFISQYAMPDFDGLELVLTLRNLDESLPVFIVSLDKYDVEGCLMKAGADAVFEVPPDAIQVAEEVKRYFMKGVTVNGRVKEKENRETRESGNIQHRPMF